MPELNLDKPLFTLSVAADLLGVHPRTLMIYETEKLVVPSRTKTNRRRYSQNDIRKLEFIQYLTRKKGVNLAGVKAILELLEVGNKHNLNLRRTVFPDSETV
jgi:MerR family transcriptional regulator/heat shock protein HspR